jgi:hypothetical protein
MTEHLEAEEPRVEVYFVDKTGGVLELIQGEVTEAHLRGALVNAPRPATKLLCDLLKGPRTQGTSSWSRS